MRPLPGLTTQEGQSAENRQEHPFHYGLTVMRLTGTYGHYHGDRTHDQDKSHQAYKSQGHRHFTDKRKSAEHFVRVGPGTGRDAAVYIRNQKFSKEKNIPH